MLEAIIALVLLIAGILSGDALWGIAAGLFAVACNINGLREEIKRK